MFDPKNFLWYHALKYGYSSFALLIFVKVTSLQFVGRLYCFTIAGTTCANDNGQVGSVLTSEPVWESPVVASGLSGVGGVCVSHVAALQLVLSGVVGVTVSPERVVDPLAISASTSVGAFALGIVKSSFHADVQRNRRQTHRRISARNSFPNEDFHAFLNQ